MQTPRQAEREGFRALHSREGLGAVRKTGPTRSMISRVAAAAHGAIQQARRMFGGDAPRRIPFAQDFAHLGTDSLTGLKNRERLLRLLKWMTGDGLGAPKSHGKIALFVIGVDRLKVINEAVGYECSDRVIADVGKKIMKAMSASIEAQTLEFDVFRLGGDEFAAVIRDTSGLLMTEQCAKAIGERLLCEIRGALAMGSISVRVSASAGAVIVDSAKSSYSTMLRSAESAMRAAKQRQPGSLVVFGAEMSEKAEAEFRLKRDLEAAVEGRQFFVVYQSKFDLVTGCLAGMEALVRWSHPTSGIISPDKFIELAEEMGLVGDIGALVLETVVTQLASWIEQGKPVVPVSVNVSRKQLMDPKLADMVGSLLSYHEVPGELLQMELTETVFAENEEQMRSFIQGLARYGVTVALDDFGKGYSSLWMLEHYDLHTIKVDRSFVLQSHTPRGSAVMKAIIDLGHALDMEVVAEGVENIQQARLMATLGCDYAQGYLYSKPAAASAVRWVRVTPPHAVNEFDFMAASLKPERVA